MRGPGILWMLQTAAGMSMAGPIFYLAGNYLLSGRYIGGVAFLILGSLVLYFPTYLVNRIGGPRTWIRRRLDRDDSSPDDGQNETAEPTAEKGTETTERTTVFDRLRR